VNGRILTVSLCTTLAVAGCGGGSSKKSAADESTPATTAPPVAPPQRTKPTVTVPRGPATKQLVAKDLIRGTGAVAQSGNQLTVQYVGVDYRTRKQFDASWDRGQPFPFQLGGGQVIPGWDKGVEGMRIGGRRELIIPASLAYGAQGQPPVIAPNATLVFVIDLLAVQ
jgi:peptidylprolyl isomerase